MTSPSNRAKKKKMLKIVSGTKKVFFKRTKTKATDTITGKKLHGVNPKAKSKTAKRPTAMFGGILSGETRKLVHEETAKIKENIKTIEDIDFKLRPYVEAALKRGEKNAGN